jgi:uncharacterized protein involved in exopolysaccharide biosynthesis
MAQEIIPAGSFYPAQTVRPEIGGFAESIKQLCFVIFKWKWLIVMVFLAFTVAAAVAMYLKPPVRSATAEILIKVDRMPLQISGFAGRQDKSQFSQIMNSEVQLIESRQVMLAVARKLLAADGNDSGKEALEEKASSLTGNTFPVALPESNVIQITHFAQTSEEAVKNLSLIIDEYIDQQAAIQSGSDKLLEFYEHEKQRVEAELRAAEDRLNQWQGRNDTVSIVQQITSHLNLLEERRKSLQQIESQVEATRAKITILQGQLSSQPERLVMEQDQVKNPLVTKLKEQRLAFEVALQDLLQKFTEKHRAVIEKKEQIALIDRELAVAEEEIISRETTSINPLKANLKQQLSDAQALLSSLVSQRQITAKQVDDASSVLAGFREKKLKVDELSRLVDINKDAFMLYGKKLEEGRIATGLGKEQLANLALIGPARAASGSDTSKRIIIIIFSAFVGLALGTAIALGFEFLNNSLRTRRDVEYHLGLPVLAAVPELPPRPLMLNQ